MGWEPTEIYWEFENKFQWCTRGENCPYCDMMDGRVYQLEVYDVSGVYPGFHEGCDCYLKRVPNDTLESDLDIFGSALSLRNNSWFEALWGKSNLWLPGWYTNPHALLEFAKPGMTAGEALHAYNAQDFFGIFGDQGFPYNLAYVSNAWKAADKNRFVSQFELLKKIPREFLKFSIDLFGVWSFKNLYKRKGRYSFRLSRDFYLRLKKNQAGDYEQIISGKSGMNPKPDLLKPKSPLQTYHDPIFNSTR